MLGQQRVADVADLSLARTSWTCPRKVPPLSWMVSMSPESYAAYPRLSRSSLGCAIAASQSRSRRAGALGAARLACRVPCSHDGEPFSGRMRDRAADPA
jgi:hypothetical protein